MTTLSVIVITKNEAHNIARCLQSVQWADEIIVLDSGSSDDTVAIAKQYTDNVFVTDWPGFGPQKNRALAKATKQWILSLDADEWLSPALQHEIQRVVKNNLSTPAAYYLRRHWIVCGKEIKHGDWGKDRVLRLFQREGAAFTDALVHEGVCIHGKIKRLRNPLYHQSILQIAQGIEKMNHYTSVSGQMKRAAGEKASLLKAVLHGLWMFKRSYILRLGFLDGKMGFYVAFLNAEHSFYKYAKLWDVVAPGSGSDSDPKK